MAKKALEVCADIFDACEDDIRNGGPFSMGVSCRVCEKSMTVEFDSIKDTYEYDESMNYCGESPSCIP